MWGKSIFMRTLARARRSRFNVSAENFPRAQTEHGKMSTAAAFTE